MKAQSPGLARLLQEFFCQHLITERNVSPQTVASYRDTFRLLLRYAAAQMKKPPVHLLLSDLDRCLVLGFLTHWEVHRKNSIRTRNVRLAAIRSFMHYVAYREPGALSAIQQVLSIPVKRFVRPVLGFLSRPEMDAVLRAPDPATWSGRRDRVMFTVCYNTGARVSEFRTLQVKDCQLSRPPSVLLHGKGRKERVVPLWKTTAALLREWLRQGAWAPESPLFPNRFGEPLSTAGIEHRLRIAVRAASQQCPGLAKRKISPHTRRHTTAMHLLQSGLELSVIALWLGHESPATTHTYVEADLAMKEKALEKLHAPDRLPIRFKPSDELLRFLDGL